MAEHAAVQPHPMKSARNWETKLRGEGLAAGNRNVYGVPTALQKKSIITSRFTEARSQLLAVKPKRGLPSGAPHRVFENFGRDPVARDRRSAKVRLAHDMVVGLGENLEGLRAIPSGV